MAGTRPREPVAFLGERLRNHPEDVTETIDYYWTRFQERAEPLRNQSRARFVELDDRLVEDVHDARLVVQTAASLRVEPEALLALRKQLRAIELFAGWYEVSGWLGTMQAVHKRQYDDIAAPLKEARTRLPAGATLFVDELWQSANGSRGHPLPERFTALIYLLWSSQQGSSDAVQDQDMQLRRLQVVLYFLMLLDDEKRLLETSFLLSFHLSAASVRITRLYVSLDTDRHFAREDAARPVHDIIDLADPVILCVYHFWTIFSLSVVVEPAVFLRRLLQVKAKKHALRFLRLWSCHATESNSEAMLGTGVTETKPPLQATERDVRVVLDVLLENALVEEALQLVGWCRNRSAKPGGLHSIFVPSQARPNASAVFAAVLEYCRANDRTWVDWLLKQHFYEDEQNEVLQFLRRYKMSTEEVLFCLHWNRLAEAKAVLPEIKGDFIPTLIQNFEMVQPEFLRAKQEPAPLPVVDVSMSETQADGSIAATPGRAIMSRAPVALGSADLFSPIKSTVPSSPYTPSLFSLPIQPRQQPRSDIAPKTLFPAIVPGDARSLGLRTPVPLVPESQIGTPLTKIPAPELVAVSGNANTTGTPTVSLNPRTPASSRRRVAPRASVARTDQ